MTDRTVVITGGSSGIGKATALLYASKGYRVYEISRKGESSSEVTHITADITDISSVRKAFGELTAYTDRIDILINNAGYGISGACEHTPYEQAISQFDVNFFGTVRVTNEALPMLKKAKGIIVNVSSVAGVLPIPFQAFYSASKAAVNSLTCSLANELRPYAVRVAAVMPGDTRTAFTDRRVKLESEEYGERLRRSVSAMERDERGGGSPAAVAKVIYAVSMRRSPRPIITAGAKYKLLVLLAKLLPLKAVNRILGSMYAK